MSISKCRCVKEFDPISQAGFKENNIKVGQIFKYSCDIKDINYVWMEINGRERVISKLVFQKHFIDISILRRKLINGILRMSKCKSVTGSNGFIIGDIYYYKYTEYPKSDCAVKVYWGSVKWDESIPYTIESFNLNFKDVRDEKINKILNENL